MRIKALQPHTIFIAVFAAALSGFLYGYNIGVYSGALLAIQSELQLNDLQIGNLIAAFDFAEAIGICLSFLADRYGRRRTMIVAAGMMIVAPLLPLLSASFMTLLVVRTLSGLATGYIFVIALVYVSEISTGSRRASMVSLVMVALTAGYLAELILLAEFIPASHWRIAIALGAAPALLQVMGLSVMKESPVYFRFKQDGKGAKAAIAYYQLPPSASEAVNTPITPSLRTIIQSLKTPLFRAQVGRGLLLAVIGSLAGHGILVKYGPMVLEYFGETDSAQSLQLLSIFTLLGFFAGFAALVPISRGQTVKVLFGSLLAMGTIQIGLGFATGAPAIALLGCLQIAFSFGIRTTVFQIMPRLFTDVTRAMGVALLNLIFTLISGVDNELLPSIFGQLGQKWFLISGVLVLMLTYWYGRLFLGVSPLRSNVNGSTDH